MKGRWRFDDAENCDDLRRFQDDVDVMVDDTGIKGSWQDGI
jgi:hypothetical protein